MDSMPKARPSFFKVLIDFDLQLRLPHDFVQKYGDILPENAKLRTRSSGKSWVVKLEHTEVEKCYFTGGWKKFSEDLGLEMGEFLVFWLSGKSTFDVSVYGISGCEREISACDSGFEDSDSDEKVKIFSKNYTYTHQNLCDLGIKQSKTCNSDKEANGTDTTAIKMNPLYFELVLKDHHRSRVGVPPAFVRKWGENFPRNVKLRISSGQTWDVKLKKMEGMDYYFTRGWTKFSEDLGLKNGELLVFRFTEVATFDVAVYGISCCEREISAINSPVEDFDPNKADEFSKDYSCMDHCARDDHAGRTRDLNIKVKSEKEDVIDPQDGCVQRFSKKLTQSNAHKLYIPKEFAGRTGITENKMIHLQDSKSRAWPVNILSWKHKSSSWFALGAGWNNFLVSNRVPAGSTILFECEVSRGNLIKTTVLNKGTKGREFSQSTKRVKGRPSKLHKPVGNINSVSSRQEECVFF